MEEFLHYGSCVALALGEGAFLYAKGFADSAAYIETFPSDLEFTMAVFRVLPACTYTIQRQVLAEAHSLSSERLALLQESLEGEMKTNIHTYAACKGAPVKFGALLQFEHVFSHKYLAVSHETAETERDHLRVGLQDFASELALFRVEAAFQFQSAGDQGVRFGDQVRLCAYLPQLNKTAFLHSSASPRAQGLGTVITFAEGRRESLLEERFEVNASLEHPSLWTVQMFCLFTPENSPELQVGDSIWLTNSELDQSLVGEGEVVLVGSNGDTNGLWALENKDETLGGRVILGRPYRLRHLSSGLYLSLRSEDLTDATALAALVSHKGEKWPSLILTLNKTEHSLWIFENIASRRNTQCLLKDEFFRVRNSAINLYLQFAIREDAVEPAVEPRAGDGGVFKVVKCGEALLMETKFLINSLPLLRRFPRFLERHAAEQPSHYREFRKFLELVHKTLTDLQLFCGNRLTSLVAFTRSYGSVEALRQKLLREQHCLEALADLLTQAFRGRFDLAELQALSDLDQAEFRDLRELAEQAYDLITAICQDNPANQRYAYQFFSLFQQQAPYLRNCIPCMVTIVSGSEELLLRVNRPQDPMAAITFFSTLLQESLKRRPQLLRFLRCLCCFHTAGLSANQEKVHEALFAPGVAVVPTAV